MSDTTTPTIHDLTRDAAQRQLDAYNAHDIDAFAACYTENVQVYDLKTNELRTSGRDALYKDYAALFERFPAVNATVTSRSIVGDVAFDREVVTGFGEAPVHAMAIYEVEPSGLIAKVWFVMG